MAIEVRVHRHVRVLLDVPQADAVLQQGLLEGKGATDDEGDQIVPPVLPDVVRFIGQFAIAKNAITRNVSADIEV